MVLGKNLLRKGFVLLLVLTLAITTMTACGDKSNSKNDTKNGNTSNSSNDTNSLSGSENAIDTSVFDNLSDADYSGLSPVSASLTKYMEAKGAAYEAINTISEQITESGNFMAGLAFLPLIGSDLIILPLTMISALPSKGSNVWEGDLFLLMTGKGRIELKGDVYVIDVEINSPDETEGKMIVTGEYDPKRDALKAVFTTNGNESVVFEYIASGDGYISQLYSKNDDNASIIRSAFDANHLYAGVIDAKGKPESISATKVTDGLSFVQNDKLMIAIENGKGYTILDGEKYDY